MNEEKTTALENRDGKITSVDIGQEMQKSFLEYAMSVIVARALPDVRDGLKPVHRRILYTMYENNLTPDRPYHKCADTVGSVLGRYHPHGDASVYDALVRLAQNFSLRYVLVDGQGNFGSVDGDPPAAYRYTEARMSKIALEMLTDIQKETVPFVPNYDERLKEPAVLPSRYPNLLVNGSTGIAVGMATNIPPHNLRETVNAVVKIIDNRIEEDRETSIEEILPIVKAPDFPTGGIILGTRGSEEAYRTGRGKIRVRAVTDIETMANGKSRIIVTELPYLVNKANLIQKIAELVKLKKIDGITDLRDESDREGMRIVIELRRDANANVIMNQLYKHTQLQESFGAIMLALVDGEPRVLNLKEMLYYYLEHQKEVVRRRTQFDLDKALARAHLVEGFLRALDIIDEVIALIRSSQTTEIARTRLMEELDFSLEQAKSILDMRLQRLTGLEKEKLVQEFEELQANIQRFQAILADPQLVLDIIKEELLVIKDKYNDERRTEITALSDEIDFEALIQEEDMVVTMTHFGYIKRVPSDTYRAQRRGGRGITAVTTRDEDFVEKVMVTSTHTDLLFFTNRGKVFQLRCHQIPEAGRTAKGSAIVNLLNLDGGEKVSTVIALPEDPEQREGMNLVMATRQGFIKKTALREYNIRKNGLIAIILREGDELINVALTSGSNDIMLATAQGKSIRFEEKLVRNMGRSTMGVTAINLAENDYVVNMAILKEDCEILTITENGYGKRTDAGEYRVTGRNCKGIITHALNEHTGILVDMAAVEGDEDIMLITSDGTIIRTSIAEIRTMGRSTQGVRVMKVDADVKVVAVATAPHEEPETEESAGEETSAEVRSDIDTL